MRISKKHPKSYDTLFQKNEGAFLMGNNHENGKNAPNTKNKLILRQEWRKCSPVFNYTCPGIRRGAFQKVPMVFTYPNGMCRLVPPLSQWWRHVTSGNGFVWSRSTAPICHRLMVPASGSHLRRGFERSRRRTLTPTTHKVARSRKSMWPIGYIMI